MLRELWVEVRRLLALGVPVAGTQLAFMLLGVVDTAMLGHYGALELAAAGIGNMWHWGFTGFAFGIVFGVEPIISQAFGRRDVEGVALGLQRGLVVAAVSSLPVCLCQALAEPALLALGQPAPVAEGAGLYCLVRLPSVPAFLSYMALRVYLQGRGIVWPGFHVGIAANVLNVALNWLLIYGNAGAPELGLLGGALATTLTSLFLPLGLALWMKLGGLFRGYTRPWDARSISRAGLRQVLHIGVPIGFQTALEGWAFAFSMGIAGWLGVTELAAHQIILNVAALLFMIPLGLSIGASTHVGNLIGAGDLARARSAMRLSLGVGAVFALVAGIGVVGTSAWLPGWFTDVPEVQAAVIACLPFVAGFQLFDATQVIASALMRAMGRPTASAVVNGVAHFGVALPLAYLWSLPAGGGLPAVWKAMALGLLLVAVGTMVWALRLSKRDLDELRVDAAS